ncbi:SDR family NAD(P)-dependent oxidoreductase [Bacillus niameyensis]|uniref:SDR family NAD(P)-dependent oxidoreductase n=1 Tax=Bacillus niameyensis TaxID=1522308 RepID=UPI000783A3A3|nr:SDR family NAD(P)-dependent oxidoreductase [Bacillus niameyensis]
MSRFQLADKVIFITGVAGLLGRVSAKMFLERGAIVVGSDIIPMSQSKELLSLQEKFNSDRFYFIQADVSDEDEVKNVFSQVKEKFGRLDGVFHNAFKQAVKPFVELTLDEWDEAIKGTLTSTFLVNKYAVSMMIPTGGGAIVNTSSVRAQVPTARNVAYGSAKAGIHQLTKVVALEHGGHGIRANVLIPGSFMTDEERHGMGAEKLNIYERKFALGRAGKAEELSEMAAFLLSDAASYVTASLFNVDGGYNLFPAKVSRG